MGRPRLKGERLPNLLAVVAEDPSTTWTPTTVDDWYGGGERTTVEVASGTAVWYSTGLLPAVPIRWVLVRDPPQGAFATQALLCTDLGAEPEQILRWFVLRVGRDRDDFSGSAAASGRGDPKTTVVGAGNPADHPGVVGSVFSLVTLFAHQRMMQSMEAVRRAAWYRKNPARPLL
jgi:hypothetical protein